MSVKRCNACGVEKPVEAFYRRPQRVGGRKPRCGDCEAVYHADYRRRVKLEVFVAYGGAWCSCCGVDTLEFLTIDHIDGDGTAHRKSVGRGGDAIYRWLRREGYPPGLRVLCFNCNSGRQVNGGRCPHETEAAALLAPARERV